VQNFREIAQGGRKPLTQKPSKRNKRKRTVTPMQALKCIGFVVLAVYICFTVIEQQKKINENLSTVRDFEVKIADANLQTEILLEELAKVDTDEYLERVAREKLKLAKPGDRIFIDSGKVR